ncbi:helix-turn-helix transcriptional regulator [Candidatus Parcubacteria bacterium]|nr:helix-turn-helix transcriptional regulator [Candidatus Parcubacteria bacterium]
MKGVLWGIALALLVIGYFVGTALERIRKRRILILEILEREPEGLFGRDIIERSGNRIRRGTIYGYLNQIEKEGLVISEEVRKEEYLGTPLRRKYKITEKGTHFLLAHKASISENNAET